ncbi:MAG: MalY/PatB family protein [Bacteroidaceae bacterium]|nr:pyridoxal phosphate-dependent aminotransferase [Prevotellaceae bacterium]MDY5631699.1 MalY/PatB family protein [Bacteroidaceae bacterium]
MYNFDQVINRRGTNSVKWDSAADGVLPLWVADMDFATAPCVQEAVQRRAQHPVFGYVRVPDSYYEAVIRWFARRHQFTMQRDWIIYTSGVVPAISAIIQALTRPGDKVLVQTPVYNCFFSSIRNSGCQLADSPLVLHENRYEIDFEDFERKAQDPAVRLFLLCNPHNPAGRAWTQSELQRLADICLRHDVFIVSDEIHNELTLPGHKYTCLGALGEPYVRNAAILTSPSKSFNIAGLQIANITIADQDIRQRVDKQININEVCDVNPFGVEALQAAYSAEGEQWLEELLAYIQENYNFLRDFFQRELPQLAVIDMEATYLPWVDCWPLGKASKQMEKELLGGQQVWFNAGDMYQPGNSTFLRINIACPRSILEEALQRFAKYVKQA